MDACKSGKRVSKNTGEKKLTLGKQGQLSHAKLLCALPVTVRVQAATESVGAEFLNSPIEESSYWGEEMPGWSGLSGSSDC